MTDLLTKVNAALKEHERWFDAAGNFLGGNGELTPLEEMAPDMVRALIAAGELADVCDELMGLFPDQRLHLENALAAFRAAMEGRTDG